MTGALLTRSLRVIAIATLCSASSVPSLRADPINAVQWWQFDHGRRGGFGDADVRYTFAATPEPTTLALFRTGLVVWSHAHGQSDDVCD